MRKAILFKPLCALLLLAGTAGSAAAAPGSQTGSQPPGEGLTGRDLPAVLAALASQQVTRRLGDGCWVRFYEDAHFRGRSITVVGPVDLARLNVRGSTLSDWDSAVVGPQATITAYAMEGFRKPAVTIGPGQRAADLQKGQRGAQGEIRSANVDCVA